MQRVLVERMVTKASRRRRKSSIETPGLGWPSHIIQYAILGALVIVPLAFDDTSRLAFAQQPKQFALHLAAAVVVIAWAIELAFQDGSRSLLPSLSGGLGKSPARWAVATAALYMVVGVLSTVFSQAPMVSLWGQNFRDLGYELYSFLSLLVLFMAVALRWRGRVEIQRVVYVFAGTGVTAATYGVSQHFGWDPFGPGADLQRVWSTFLNPIFFGSFLVMSIFLTVTAALLWTSDHRHWRWQIMFAVALGVQLAALWFAGSRGPLIGATVGGVVLVSVAALKIELPNLLRGLPITVGGLVVAILLVVVPAGDTRGVASLSRAISETTQLATTLSGAPDESLASGLSGRVGIWSGAFELATSWEVVSPENGISSALRPVFGFGPEMYIYSYPLTAGPDGLRGVHHPHNYLLQTLLEMGVAGLLTLLALAGLIIVTILRLIWPGSSTRPDPWVSIVAVGLLAALVGRAVEQMGGVAAIGDLAPYWILMGLVVAVSESATPEHDTTPAPRSRRRRSQPLRDFSVSDLARIGGAIIVVFIVAGVFVLKDVQQLEGSRAAVEANRLAGVGQGSTALVEFQRAIALAPDVTEYAIRLHELVSTAATSETDPETKQALLEVGYDALVEASARDPYDPRLLENLSRATVDLFENGETDRRDEVIRRYISLGESLPDYPDIQALVANGFIVARAFDLGLVAADISIGLGGDQQSQSRAWWARGVSLAGLGDPAGAIDSFERSITLRPEGQWAAFAHGGLAEILESQGKSEEAAEHRALRNQ